MSFLGFSTKIIGLVFCLILGGVFSYTAIKIADINQETKIIEAEIYSKKIDQHSYDRWYKNTQKKY